MVTAAAAHHRAVESFLHSVATVVSTGGSEQAVTAAVAGELRRLVPHGLGIVPDGMDRPLDAGYAMYPFHVPADGSFSVAVAVWGIGQVTPIHDHGTWGVIGILAGVEHEERFALAETGRGAPTSLGARDLGPGEVVVCCTSDQDVHRVACASDVPTVALHVYGADIGRLERHAFDPGTGEARTFVSRWAQPVR